MSVTAAGLGPVADLGCGTAQYAAHLDSLGLEAFGIDLSSAMVDCVRRTDPHLRIKVGSITALELSEATPATSSPGSTIH